MNRMICKKNDCTGCFACYNICPKDAIIMKEDVFGNIYPYINKDKCINCSLCREICPQLNKNSKFHNPTNAFALYNKDHKKRLESSSGGAASLFYEYILDNNGVVYGVSSIFNENSFSFICVDTKEKLFELKGSKYVHCYINNAFQKIKNNLDTNKKVLFIGTPCQVDGLKNYLRKDYTELYTIDIICHGVSSQKLFYQELEKQKIDIKKIKKVSFRDSNLYLLKLFDIDNNVIFSKQADQIDYYRNFLQGNIYRENCYNCKYAKNKRISDITIGDFWGLDKESSIYDSSSDGISLVMTNTVKGKELFNKIKKYCIYEERSINEATKHNGQLNNPMEKTKKNRIYTNNYEKLGYKKTMNKMLSHKEKIIYWLKSKRCFYKVIKKIRSI